MKRFSLVALVLLSGIILLSCRSREFEQSMNAAIGRMTISDAIASWGPPSYDRKIGDSTIMAWTQTQYHTYSPPPPSGQPYGAAGEFAHGLAKGLSAHSYTWETRNTLTIQFDAQGIMRAWSYRDR